MLDLGQNADEQGVKASEALTAIVSGTQNRRACTSSACHHFVVQVCTHSILITHYSSLHRLPNGSSG
jgi:hypothetical protein